MPSLFAYGSLMSGAVIKKVINRIPVGVVAKLNGYHRFRVNGELYPAIYPSFDSEVVEGMLYEGISDEELATFDDYEGDQYIRMEVEVQTAEKEKRSHSFVYIMRKEFAHLLHGDWSYDEYLSRERLFLDTQFLNTPQQGEGKV